MSLISDPRASAEFGRLYTVDLVGNVVEGSGVLYNNQPMDVLVEACRQSVTVLGEPVWYSCEVDQKFASELGVEDLQMYAGPSRQNARFPSTRNWTPCYEWVFYG